MSRFTQVAPVDPETHPGFRRLWNEGGFRCLKEDTLEDFLGAPGLKLVVFADDPNKQKETLDIVVIGPEIAKTLAAGLEGKWFSDVVTGRALASRWGVKRLPAIALFRNRVYLGAAEGLKGWDDYLSELTQISKRTEGPRRQIAILAARE